MTDENLILKSQKRINLPMLSQRFIEGLSPLSYVEKYKEVHGCYYNRGWDEIDNILFRKFFDVDKKYGEQRIYDETLANKYIYWAFIVNLVHDFCYALNTGQTKIISKYNKINKLEMALSYLLDFKHAQFYNAIQLRYDALKDNEARSEKRRFFFYGVLLSFLGTIAGAIFLYSIFGVKP